MIAASGTLSLWQVAHDQRGEGKGRLRTHNVPSGATPTAPGQAQYASRTAVISSRPVYAASDQDVCVVDM